MTGREEERGEDGGETEDKINGRVSKAKTKMEIQNKREKRM